MNIGLNTKRLTLRLYQENDLDDVAVLNADSDVREFFPGGTLNKAQTKERMNELMSFYKNYGLPCFVIHEKETGEFIGRCGFGPIERNEIEVGYLIAKKHWGKGYATEVLISLLGWAKDHIKADYILAFAPVNHMASHRVMQKAGMKYFKTDIGHGVSCKFYKCLMR